MEHIGFSTGSIARSDVHAALGLLAGIPTGAVELSALRVAEFHPLVHAIPTLPLHGYHSVSVHAPSAFPRHEERDIVRALVPLARRGWHVVVHPDALHDFGLWAGFGSMLCVENMDRRKPVGRTAAELRSVFTRLPDASFCLDLAHVWQCDPSLDEAARMLHDFGERLAQVHVSELDRASRHVRLTEAGARAYEQVAALIPLDVSVIIESPVQAHEMEAELEICLQALGRAVAFA